MDQRKTVPLGPPSSAYHPPSPALWPTKHTLEWETALRKHNPERPPKERMADASCCCLSALPAELVDVIFFEIDSVRALASFITTSRSIYHCFKPRKRAILFRVLQNELGPILTDAQFLSVFPYADPTDLGYYEWIHAMAAVYKDMLGGDGRLGGSSGGGTAPPSLQGLTTLCHTLHQINFLADTYIATQLCSFGGEASRTRLGSAACAPVSRTEWLRVLRAFYRRQIVSNAYAPTKRYRRPDTFQHWFDEDTAAITNTGAGGDQRSFRPGLFDAFEPWEVQQIDHANHFITRLCVALRLASEPEEPEVVGALSTTGGGDVSRSGGSSALLLFQPQTTTAAVGSGPINEHEFGELFSHVDRLTRYLREHPSVAEAALRDLPMPKGSDGGGRRDVAATYRLFVTPFAIQSFSYAWQWSQSEVMPDPVREQRERDATTVDFAGDALNLVPFAWVDALGGRYANWFGEALSSIPWAPALDDDTANARYNSSELWRDAGFALWDRRRVKAIKEEVGWLSSLGTGWAVR